MLNNLPDFTERVNIYKNENENNYIRLWQPYTTQNMVQKCIICQYIHSETVHTYISDGVRMAVGACCMVKTDIFIMLAGIFHKHILYRFWYHWLKYLVANIVM